MNGEDEMDHYTNFNVFLVATQCLLWYAYSMYSSIKETCRYLATSGCWFDPSRSHLGTLRGDEKQRFRLHLSCGPLRFSRCAVSGRVAGYVT